MLDRDGKEIELKEDEDAMDTFNLARMDAEDERHRRDAFADEAEFADAGFAIGDGDEEDGGVLTGAFDGEDGEED